MHRVVVVDDDPSILELLTQLLGAAADIELVGTATDGVEAVNVVGETRPDVVLMDVAMPYLDGARATEKIVHAYPATKVLAHTGRVDTASVTRMIVAGAVGYAVKGRDPSELIAAIGDAAARTVRVDPAVLPNLFQSVVALARTERERRREAERLHTELRANIEETIGALAAALESRDQYTGDHDDRVASLSVAVGARMGMEEPALTDLRYGAAFHDIGKLAIPDSILRGCKPELSPDEWDVVKMHTIVGERILSPISFLRGAALVVRHSHEHWDGGGYPDGLAGDSIPLASRIVLACDAFDAMTSGRTYQASMTREAAIARLHELSGTHFDPAVVEALVAHLVESAPVQG